MSGPEVKENQEGNPALQRWAQEPQLCHRRRAIAVSIKSALTTTVVISTTSCCYCTMS